MPSADTGVVTYDDPDSRAHTAILALAQDARGYLWIGTEHGPVRFDGMEWGTPHSLDALSTFDSWALDAQEPHAIWVGTSGAGLWLVDSRPVPERGVATLSSAHGLADDDVHTLCRAAAAGALWVGTHHGLAVVQDRRVSACWTSGDGIPEAGICALCDDPAGGVWAGSLHGLLRVDRGGLRAHLTREDGLPDEAVYALCMDAEGRVWAGTRHGIAIVEHGRVQATLQAALPSPEVRALCCDGAGRMWAGTAKGLACIAQGRVRSCWTRAEHLPSSSVWALLCDRENRLWVGTEGGLALLPQQDMPVRTLPLHGDAASSAATFATDQQGRTWIGTASGLVTVAPDARTPNTPPPLPPVLEQAGVWVTHRDATGAMWVAGRYGGLYCLDPATGAVCRHVEDINAVRCLADDPEGRLWVGTLGVGLACVDRDRGILLRRLTVAQGLPSDHVLSLCLDRRGRLWVGTLGGVAGIDCQRGVVAVILGMADGLPHLSVSGLTLGSGDQLWGTTRGGGLFRVDLTCDRVNGVWSTADGLPSDALVSCTVDADGELWLGTMRGLARYLPATGACLTLGRPHGLPGESCQQGALRLDEQGRLWVGTTNGVAVVTPRDVPREIPRCSVFLTGLQVMGQQRDVVQDLEIEDSDYDLVIEYGAVTFVAAAQVLYRTQLVGLDSAWSASQPHRFARYTNLRPGAYTFRVAARNWDGQWSAPCEWRFRVVRGRRGEELDRAQRRAEAAEAAVRVRNEVLRAVAHDLRTPLTGIIGHADMLQGRLERDAPLPQDWLHTQARALHDGAWRMAAMVDEIMDVVHLQMGQRVTLRLAPVDVAALVQAVAGTLMAAGSEAAVAVDAAPNLVVQGDGARLARVVENLIGNAIKYSAAEMPVYVSAYAREDGVSIRVRDNGVGIPASELPEVFTPYYRASTARGIHGTGLGLAGARAIVEQHGGQITLESRLGQGTTVTVLLPRHAQHAGERA